MKTVAFTIVLLVAVVGSAKTKTKAKNAGVKSAKVADTRDAKIKLQKVTAKMKADKIQKSRSDLSSAISESYEGRKEIQKDVQNAAGIEKITFEPSKEQFRVEIPSSSVSSAGDDAPEPKFVAPKRGPASVDTKGLMKEIDESEKESD